MVPGDYGRVCPHCKNQVGLQLIHRQETVDRNGGRIYLYLCRCPICGKGVVLEAGTYDNFQDIYPTASLNQWEVHEIPDPILDSYTESVTAYLSGAFGLTAVGCRRTVEAVGRDKNITGKYAKTMIQTMVKKGLLTQEFSEAVNHVRLQGNIGAHEGPISQDEAERTLRFTQELLRILYEIPAELKKVSSPKKGDQPISPETESLEQPVV